MAIAPKGDPRRPLQLAVRSCYLLGLIFIAISMIAGAALFAGGRGMVQWFAMALAVLVFATPGVLYIVTAVFLKRGKTWAVILGIIVASLHALCALLACVGAILDAGRSPVVAIITVLWVVAMGQLIHHLAQCPAAIRADVVHQPRGFEVLPMSTRVSPPVESPVETHA